MRCFRGAARQGAKGQTIGGGIPGPEPTVKAAAALLDLAAIIPM